MSNKDSFERDGFLVLPQFYPGSSIDRVQKAVNALVTSKPPFVTCDDMVTGDRLLLKDAGERREISRLKINDLHLDMRDVRSLALNSMISPILAELLEQEPLLCNSLYFEKGSSQPKHIDSLYMTPQTLNHLIAIWVALEDAHHDSGPLEYYPGSHKITPMRFSDGSYHANDAQMPQWNAFITEEVARLGLTKQSFPARKGDVFIWHANLLHGGGAIKDTTRTRKSFVFHYYSAHDGRSLPDKKVSEGGAKWLLKSHPTIMKSIEPDAAASAGDFSEAGYMARYPDVFRAVQSGQFTSGRHHFDAFGRAEGRSPG